MPANKFKLTAACTSLAANALSGGSIFTFPLIAPALAFHLKLTQSQLSSIVLAAVAGQYPFSSLVGKVSDRFGSGVCSLIAASSFSLAYGMMSWEITHGESSNATRRVSVFHGLLFAYLIAGLGTVFSYFSSVFGSSRIFPRRKGLAIGLAMSLFGLSPLFLSLFSPLFSDPSSNELNVANFTKFLCVYLGFVHLVGAFLLPNSLPKETASTFHSEISDEEHLENEDGGEETRLLRNESSSRQEASTEAPSAASALRDPTFWLLAIFLFIVLGIDEMIITNIGSITESLPPGQSGGPASQVRFISFANTISRIISGPLGDYLAPKQTTGLEITRQKIILSRASFLCFAAALTALGTMYTYSFVSMQSEVWVISLCTGITYGVTFTALPGILENAYGSENLGFIFGIITYAPFAGTPVFTYIYAHLADREGSADEASCTGTGCWALTFLICSLTSLIALFCGACLWYKWRKVL